MRQYGEVYDQLVAARVSTLIPREAGCDSWRPPGLGRSIGRFNPHPARGGMRHAVRRLRSQHLARFNPHPARGGMRPRPSWSVSMSTTMFQPSSRARRDATSFQGLGDYDVISGFNPHPARGGMRPSPGAVRAADPESVSTLIPREAGCDRWGSRSRSPPAGQFQPSSRARRDATALTDVLRFHVPEVSTLIPREAGCDPHPRWRGWPLPERFQPSSRARRDATRRRVRVGRAG